ncbi:unnamed protein product [Lymnaea stagnalis]|uniref:Uncharacterized protein n=1 Tax=Lymnaea stagnalis TaxID=6523 RepID=A0AAV2IIU6_LYMST
MISTSSCFCLTGGRTSSCFCLTGGRTSGQYLENLLFVSVFLNYIRVDNVVTTEWFICCQACLGVSFWDFLVGLSRKVLVHCPGLSYYAVQDCPAIFNMKFGHPCTIKSKLLIFFFFLNVDRNISMGKKYVKYCKDYFLNLYLREIIHSSSYSTLITLSFLSKKHLQCLSIYPESCTFYHINGSL